MSQVTEHNHDLRYYRRAEIDYRFQPSYLMTKIRSVDGHGSLLDADTVDGLHGTDLATAGHAHDSRYYTETESDALLAAKSPTTHHHDATYGRLGVNNTWSGVNRFAGDALGIAARLWDAGRDVPLADHFRSGAITPGYAWAGSPFVTPSYLAWNNWSDYLLALPNTPPYAKSFLCRSVPNHAANWNYNRISARVRAANLSKVGVRFDNGTNNNFVELLMDGAAGDGTQRLSMRKMKAGVQTYTQSNLVIPTNQFMTIMLLSYFSGSDYYGIGYVASEDSGAINVDGLDVMFNAGTFPAAGRIGVVVEDGSTWSVAPGVDWFAQSFA